MNSYEHPNITMPNTNMFTMYLHITHKDIYDCPQFYCSIPLWQEVLHSGSKGKIQASIFMKNNAKHVMSNFLLETTRVIIGLSLLLPED